MRDGFAEKGDVGPEYCPWFPSQPSWTFLINQFWLLNGTILVYNHTHMYFGPEQRQNEFIFLQNGDLFHRKWSGWSGNITMIPILGFMNLGSELILNLNWFIARLQPHRYVFWAITATKLVHFPPKWGLALQKMERLDWKIVHDSHPRLHEPS